MNTQYIVAIERSGFAQISNLLTEKLRRELVVLFGGDEDRVSERSRLAFNAVCAAATSGVAADDRQSENTFEGRPTS
ncbi:MAG: hypothetical protein ACI8X5_000456 [Planctomycetota bacterium]|jgi:hypothetical protein